MNIKNHLSPSSINLFRQCPLKWFKKYKQKQPTLPNIHLVRGKIVHEILEGFYNIPGFLTLLKTQKLLPAMKQMLSSEWLSRRKELNELEMDEAELQNYYSETLKIIEDFYLNYVHKLYAYMEKLPGLGEMDYINRLTPHRERKYHDPERNVIGYIDVVEERDGIVRIIDYKTASKHVLTTEYKRQLAIYSYLYLKQKGRKPDEAGILFIKNGVSLKVKKVTDELIEYAINEIDFVRARTQSDDIKDYEPYKTPLCGYCAFKKVCPAHSN